MNLLKGEVEFTAGGKRWVLCLNFNALCSLEQVLGIRDGDFGRALSGPTAIRAAFFVGLKGRHPEITEEAVGDLLTELGMTKPSELVMEALKWAMPEAEEATGKADPQ